MLFCGLRPTKIGHATICQGNLLKATHFMAAPYKNQQALDLVEELLVQGMMHGRICERVAKACSMAPSTIRDYITHVRRNWREMEAERREDRRSEFRAMAMENWRQSIAQQNASAGAATLKILAKLDGLEAPAEIRVTGAVDVRALAPMERQAEIERLIAARALHLSEGGGELIDTTAEAVEGDEEFDD